MRALVTMTWNPLVFVLLIVVTVGCKSTGSGIGESPSLGLLRRCVAVSADTPGQTGKAVAYRSIEAGVAG
jgi:hypothetical protein